MNVCGCIRAHMCMRMCIWLCMYVYMYKCISGHTPQTAHYVNQNVLAELHMYVCVDVYARICVCVCDFVYMYTCTNVYLCTHGLLITNPRPAAYARKRGCICMYMCMRIWVCIHVYMYKCTSVQSSQTAHHVMHNVPIELHINVRVCLYV